MKYLIAACLVLLPVTSNAADPYWDRYIQGYGEQQNVNRFLAIEQQKADALSAMAAPNVPVVGPAIPPDKLEAYMDAVARADFQQTNRMLKIWKEEQEKAAKAP